MKAAPIYPFYPATSTKAPGKFCRQTLLILFGVGLLLVSDAFAQIPTFRQYSLKQGLPQSEISSIMEDSRGLVWIGTKGGGLVEFDGYSFKIFNQKQNLSNNFVCDVQEKKNGQLAVGVTYAGVNFFRNRTFTEPQADWRSLNSELKKLITTDTQTIAIGNLTLLGVSENSPVSVLHRFAHEVHHVLAAAAVAHRWVLVSTDSGLLAVDLKLPSRTLLLLQKTHLKGNQVVGIQSTGPKAVSLVSASGLSATISFENGWPVLSAWAPIPVVRLRPGEEITQVVYGLGAYPKWFATNRKRIFSSENEEIDFEILPFQNVQNVTCLAVDRNQNLWIGTGGSGVIVKPPNAVFNYDNFERLRNNGLKAVYRASNGLLLAGGSKTGLIACQDGATKWDKVVVPRLSVFAIAEGADSYFLGCDDGLYVVDKKSFTIRHHFLQTGRIASLKTTDDGRLLVGSYGNGPWVYTPGTEPATIQKIKNSPDYCYGFEKTDRGHYLLSSNAGLWSLDIGAHTSTLLAVPDSVGRSFFISTTDNYGNRWFAVPDGLAGKTAQGWRKIGLKNGLSSLLVYTLNADPYGHLWVGTNHGIDRISVDPLGGIKEIRNFGPAEGYEGYEANMRASYVDQNHLTLCTIEGLFSIPLQARSLDPLPARPTISAFRLTTSAGSWSDSLVSDPANWFHTPKSGIELAERGKGVAFSFLCINPFYPQKLNYSYRLIGSSDEWSPLAAEKEAYFVGLRGGNYTFQVRSSYDGHSFSEPASFQFSIPYAWYQSKWIVGLIFVVFLLGSYLVFRFINKGVTRTSLSKREFITPETTSQFLLLLAAVLHPFSYLLTLKNANDYPGNKLLTFGSSALVLVFFLITVFTSGGKARAYRFLQAAFMLFLLIRFNSVLQTNVNPLHVISLLFISSLAYLVFDKFWQVIGFGILLVAFSLYCLFSVEIPAYNPTQLLVYSVVIFLILIITLYNKKRYQARLQFSDTVVNTGPSLILGFQNDGNLIFSSDNLKQLLGIASWQVQKRKWQSSLMVQQTDTEAILDTIAQESPGSVKIRLKKSSGEVRTFDFTARRINEALTVMIGQDTTDAQSLETKFEQLVINAPDCIYQTDFYGSMIYANPQTSYLLGVSEAELIGKHFAEFIREDRRAEVLAFYNRQFKDKATSTYLEFPVVTRSGNVRWLGFQVQLLTKVDGKTVEGYLSIGRDITERLEAEQLIQHQHKNITDSLSYASRIKQALLPGEDDLARIFSQVAVLNQPKDIIGGDFFWLRKLGRRSIFVLGDCTGHGVPGAFMTTIAVGLLGQIVKEDSRRNSESLLGLFNKALSRLLKSNFDSETNDFVELAICIYDSELHELEFISSGIGLHRIRNGALTSFNHGSHGLEYKFDYRGMAMKMPVEDGDQFFVFTDGMYDQIGGPGQKRFMKKRLLQAILAAQGPQLSHTVALVKEQLDAWQENNPQIDDRMLVAFRW